MRVLIFAILLISSSSLPLQANNKDKKLDEAMIYQANKFDKFLKNKNLVYGDTELKRYMQEIMYRLFPDYSGELNVHIHKAPILNAFAIANGSIYINVSLISACENEAQLAAVLAHEGIHYINKHMLKGRKHADRAVGMEMAVGALTGGVSLIFSNAVTKGAVAGYSRELETEADNEGFKRYVSAGYDPSEAGKMFEILLEEVKLNNDKQAPYFYSSHPALEKRIDNYKVLSSRVNFHNEGIVSGEIYNKHVESVRKYNISEKLNTGQYKSVVNELTKLDRGRFYGKHYKYYIAEAYRLSAELKDYKEAESNYLSSIHDAPEFSGAYRSLGTLYFKQKRCYPAVKNFEKYLDVEPNASDKSYVNLYIKQCEQGLN